MDGIIASLLILLLLVLLLRLLSATWKWHSSSRNKIFVVKGTRRDDE